MRQLVSETRRREWRTGQGRRAKAARLAPRAVAGRRQTPGGRAAGLAQAKRSDDLGQGRPSPGGPSCKHATGATLNDD
jgi:hypothetical protein